MIKKFSSVFLSPLESLIFVLGRSRVVCVCVLMGGGGGDWKGVLSFSF